ncbi:MAG TPA: prepilin-type N-terminal cleavage/methylation domain-containing protein, partial [Verrucomicrobiae bacterium]|nr:prepilin-type N-terminal cleavage/methylation domain-containing protein [Verrucomicrobiae bacterium]
TPGLKRRTGTTVKRGTSRASEGCRGVPAGPPGRAPVPPCARSGPIRLHVPCPATPHSRSRLRGFTLVELLLVMTIMVAAISVAAPTLANFFRGRTLDSETRRLLALTHNGQSRAVSEGIPTRLWLDVREHTYGLEQDPGWSDRDPKAVEFPFDNDLTIEVIQAEKPRSFSLKSQLPSNAQAKANPRNLPEIRFLPDGTIDQNSPRALHLEDRNGTSRWLAQTTNHLSYEIRDTLD